MKFLAILVFKITGWKISGTYPQGLKKCVMIAAPHTSNWDLLFARAAFFILEVPVRYTIKKEIMKFPLGNILAALGAIPIDRSKKNKVGKKNSVVEAMIDLYNERDRLVIMITPEGTRKYAPKWKTGFYHIAVGANVPIVLGFLDYKRKLAGIGPTVYPTGNLEEDIEKIKEFYRGITAKYPEQGVK
jgi:1-acyl-sn-glycerol-3-phosphate acyltransferase